jgi:hypothetical protein
MGSIHNEGWKLSDSHLEGKKLVQCSYSHYLTYVSMSVNMESPSRIQILQIEPSIVQPSAGYNG